MSSLPDSYGKSKAVRGKLSSPRLRRTVQFAMQSIRLRFGRCLVTTASVICAVAFLSYNALFLEQERVRARAKTPARSPTARQEAGPAAAGVADFFAELEAFTAEKNAIQKRMFVIALSLLVCSVGIMNSMLMSVKERFREIATLKCLGAVNAYIRELFVIESLLQGGLGSLLGLVLGIALYLAMQGAAISIVWLMKVSVACLAIGVVMTLLASVFPIRAALRMTPIEALRVEE